ncbi:hypothetical protein [Kitasatospora sp. RG8]|uniref:hypothetical protein n=1 Tax=Kitasatospora sp. RG8 TaxID=2820815 RepID=UPI0035A83913
MSRRLGRLGRLTGAAVLTFALASGGVGLGTAPASAAPTPIEQCTTTSGVVLAVDFSRWGGPLLRSCGTTPTTGYALLNQGGWKTTGTGHDGPAFICRIGYSGFQGGKQYPAPDQEKCVLTPPATAYWSYWHADPGQNDWSYSQLGAMSYQPKPGSVDLWIFGGTNIEGTEGRPAIPPDSVRARNTSPGGAASTPEPPRPPAGGGGAAGGGSGGTSGGSGTGTGGNGTGTGGNGGGSAGANGGSSSGTGSSGSSSGANTGGSSGATKRPSSGGGAGGSSGATGGRTAPVSPSAEAPAPADPQTPAAEATAAPAGTPSAQSSDTPSVEASATATPTAADGPSPSVEAGGPRVVDAAPAADTPHDPGSMVPAAVGAVLVVVLGVVTAVTARRRRRQAE